MKPLVLAVAGAMFLLPSAQAVDYVDFNYTGGAGQTVITGIRGYDTTSDNVFITGSYVLPAGVDGATAPIIYQGSLSQQDGTWTVLTPIVGDQDITTATLYGPNTALYDPTLDPGGVRAVGSYKYQGGGSGDHGLMYVKNPTTAAVWTQIDVPSDIIGGSGESVLNTIAHSTIGNFVVGNYDTADFTGHAFIYSISANKYQDITPTGSASLTAYGIWQNADGTYTIAGGYSDITNGILDAGYLVDFIPDSLSEENLGVFDNFTPFQYDNNDPDAVISHFDGITAAGDGYNLTGDHVTDVDDPQLGFFAHIGRNPDGTFGEAYWQNINVTGASVTSGNTVYRNNVLGVYVTEGESSSYVATVPEPSSLGLLITGLLGLAAARRRA